MWREAVRIKLYTEISKQWLIFVSVVCNSYHQIRHHHLRRRYPKYDHRQYKRQQQLKQKHGICDKIIKHVSLKTRWWYCICGDMSYKLSEQFNQNQLLYSFQDPCIVGYTYLTTIGRCYMFDPVTLMTWDEARSSCMDDGGDLMGHETSNELLAISNWITPGLYISRHLSKEH